VLLNPVANVGLTTRNFTWGSSTLIADFDIVGTEQFTYTATLNPGNVFSVPLVLTGPTGSTNLLPANSGTTGTLTPGHWTVKTQIIGHQGDNIPGAYSYDFAATPEPTLAEIPLLLLALRSGRTFNRSTPAQNKPGPFWRAARVD
jgi:hypothetical protein